jgi:hypothetical protein
MVLFISAKQPFRKTEASKIMNMQNLRKIVSIQHQQPTRYTLHLFSIFENSISQCSKNTKTVFANTSETMQIITPYVMMTKYKMKLSLV